MQSFRTLLGIPGHEGFVCPTEFTCPSCKFVKRFYSSTSHICAKCGVELGFSPREMMKSASYRVHYHFKQEGIYDAFHKN